LFFIIENTGKPSLLGALSTATAYPVTRLFVSVLPLPALVKYTLSPISKVSSKVPGPTVVSSNAVNSAEIGFYAPQLRCGHLYQFRE